MSATNGTSNPFVSQVSEAQSGLYKGIGVSLAVASGIFIGSSFVFKKKGLLQSIEKSGGVAGEGYMYLKSIMWWAGMILMIVGELCNFIAYAFTQAILVTPLGALSVVISAVLSSIFLKEKLSFQGKIGCLQCILGAIVIVLHAPEQSSADTTIETFKHLVLSVGFLVYGGLAIIVSSVLVFYCGPRWGKKNMLVYICVCSLIGSISVVFTQGLGAAIVHSITIENQFTNWFIYIVLAITIITLLIEIVYLNKALNLFNTALVTPTYYVIFTTMTIVSSIVLYRGFDASPVDVATCVLGFLSICSGVALLHNSNSQPHPEATPAPVDTEKQLFGDDEKILLDEPVVVRKKSMFQMFEKENAEIVLDHEHGSHTPGAADLFPAPFSGISRYASTTKKSQSMINRNRLQSISNTTIAKTEEEASPRSINNMTLVEESLNHDKWSKDLEFLPSGAVGQYNDSFAQSMITSSTTEQSFTRKHSASVSSHRAQDELGPISSFRMQINSGEKDDREGLVDN